MTARTLVLTSWYFPHKIVCWQDAITLMYLGKVDVVASYDEEIRSPSTTLRTPAVVRLKRMTRAQKHGVKFSRMNVYLRDDFPCAYCGKRFAMSQLTYDHVLPRCRGGKTAWDNIVTACRPCNSRKADKTPDQAGMWPRTRPIRPKSLPFAPPLFDPKTAPPEWQDYCAVIPRMGVA